MKRTGPAGSLRTLVFQTVSARAGTRRRRRISARARGRKEDSPGNVEILSSPKETTELSIPNVEHGGAFSHKEAHFQAWLLCALAASLCLVKTHSNSALVSCTRRGPKHNPDIIRHFIFRFMTSLCFFSRLYLLFMLVRMILTLLSPQAPLVIPFLFYTISRSFLSLVDIKKES